MSVSSEDHFLDQQPRIFEITKHAKTSEWNQLGVALQLNAEDLLDAMTALGCISYGFKKRLKKQQGGGY